MRLKCHILYCTTINQSKSPKLLKIKESCGDAVLTVYRENGADGDIDVSKYHKYVKSK